jgi:pilus assembly protein CpaE
MHNEFMAFIKDEASAATVRAWAEQQGFPSDSVQNGGPDLFANLLESDAPPKLALVDIDNQEQPLRAATRLVSLCGPATKLVVLGSANDVGLYRGMLAAGIMDYLLKPLTQDTLTQVLAQAARGGAQAGAAKDMKVIVVAGVRGGVGASTVAVNVGWLIAHEMKQKCVLLDLDLQFGTSALALDLEPGHGLRDIVSSPQRVDSLMIAGAQANESELFSILSAEEPVDEPIPVDGGAIAALLKELRPTCRVIIIDLPRHLLATQKRLLSLANEVVLVTEMSLAGIRDTLRARTVLKSLGSAARVTIVAAQVGPLRPAAVDEATFAKGAQAKIDFTLPDDHKNVTAASNAGKMLAAVAGGSPLTKTLRQLAEHLAGSADGNGKKKGWGSWFGGSKQAAPQAGAQG